MGLLEEPVSQIPSRDETPLNHTDADRLVSDFPSDVCSRLTT